MHLQALRRIRHGKPGSVSAPDPIMGRMIAQQTLKDKGNMHFTVRQTPGLTPRLRL